MSPIWQRSSAIIASSHGIFNSVGRSTSTAIVELSGEGLSSHGRSRLPGRSFEVREIVVVAQAALAVKMSWLLLSTATEVCAAIANTKVLL